MWLARLDLLAFGRFTNVQLDLGPGFHLIYGPNEAGKSTTLRAIRQLLFGFDERTDDNFVHQNPQLRIGGVVRNQLGESLDVIRRKSRKESLRAGDDTTVIDDQRWQEFLCGIDEATFSNRYGIDYERLVEGGREIATGTGDLGEILFATGSGVMDLAAVQKRLQEEAAELFKPQGKKQKINQAISEWQLQRELVAAKLLPVADWEEADRSRQQAVDELDRVTKEIDQKVSDENRHRRWQQAIPLLGKRKTSLSELESLTTSPELPDHFVISLQETALLLKHADEQERAERKTIVDTESELGRFAQPGVLAERGDDLTQLLTGWGSYHKAQLDRPQLVSQLERVKASIVELQSLSGRSSDLVIDEMIVPDRTHRARIGQLGRQKTVLLHDVQNARQQREELKALTERTEAVLASLALIRPLTELREAVRNIRLEGDLDQQLLRIQVELTELQSDSDSQLKALAPWTGPSELLTKLRVPDPQQLVRWDVELRANESARALLMRRRTELAAEGERLKRQIDVLKREFQIPTEADLLTARRTRDEVGDTLRSRLNSHQGEADSLLDEYQQRIIETDLLVDRLRKEADRVAQFAEHQSDLAELDARQRDIMSELSALDNQRTEFDRQWTAAWPELGFAPKSPSEMQNWISRREVWLRTYELQSRRTKEARHVERRRRDHQALLARLLIDEPEGAAESSVDRQEKCKTEERLLKQAASEKQQTFIWVDPLDESQRPENLLLQSEPIRQKSLSELLLMADERIQRAEEIQQARNDADERLARHRTDFAIADEKLRLCTEQLERVEDEWRAALLELNLPGDLSPDSIAVVIDSISELADLRRQAEQLGQRIAGIDADAALFSASVVTLCRDVAPDLIEQRTEDAVTALRSRALSAQKDQAAINQLVARKSQAERSMQSAMASRARSVQSVAELCVLAGMPALDKDVTSEKLQDTLHQLQTVEANSRRRHACKQEIARIDSALRDLAEEIPIDEFIGQANAVSSDELTTALLRLDKECDQLTDRRDELLHELGGLEQRLQQMDGSTEAADAEEKQRQWLAKIHADSDQYVRLKLASTVLRAAIERYREKIRGPVLSAASALFRELTLESFEGLRVVEDDNGHPILVGLRSDQREMVKVTGMSEGTCDQLYLALRLASLSLEAAPRNRLPFIADDILIQFDDTRSAATLRILSRLAKERQVIFFTHHEHLLDIARKLPPGDFEIHRLDC